MTVKYLGVKVGIVLATFAATPIVWAGLAYPEWQASPADGALQAPTEAPPVLERRVVIVPRLVDARTGSPLDAELPAAPQPAGAPVPVSQQPAVSAPPPQPPRQHPVAPARSAATTRGS